MTVKAAGSGKASFRLACRSVDYPYAENARFQSEDEFLSRSWEVSKNNLRSSTNDAAVDCCNRENLLWAFDAFVTCKAAFYSFGDTRMWRRCLDLIAQGIDSDGRPSGVVPTEVPSSLYGQAMHLPVSIHEYYMATGDRSLVADAAPAIGRYLALCEKHVTGEDLFVPPAWSWFWEDWAPIDKRPYSLPINALLVLCCDAAGRLAAIAGDSGLAALAARISRRVRRAISRFYDAKRRAFRSHIEPRKKLVLPPLKPNSRASALPMTVTHNVHGNVLAAVTGCGTATQRRAAMVHAAKCFAAEPGPINEIGIGYVDILLSPLVAAGHTAAAMHAVRSMYQPFLDINAPTWAETAKEVDAHNTAHGWAAALNSFIVEGLIGLRPAAPGWTAISLDPAAGQESDFSYSLETPAGLVEVKRAAGRVTARWPRGVALMCRGRMRRGTGRSVVLA
jgi:hypothetical protein